MLRLLKLPLRMDILGDMAEINIQFCFIKRGLFSMPYYMITILASLELTTHRSREQDVTTRPRTNYHS